MKNLRLFVFAIFACIAAAALVAIPSCRDSTPSPPHKVGSASPSYLYFSAPVGDQGTFPIAGTSYATLDAASTRALLQAEYAGGYIKVTSTFSLSSTVTLGLPLIEGEEKSICNLTTGGQSIVAIATGDAGTGVTIANGTCMKVLCSNGTNYVALSGATGAAFDPANPGPIGGSDAGAGTFTDLVATSSETFSNAIGFANGTPRFFGNGSVVYSSDADKDISGIPNAYTSPVLEITATGGGLTAPRNLTVPFGGPWWVLNRTTQTINIGGSSGSRVGVPAGAAVSVVSNTGNFFGGVPINLASSAFVTGLLPASNGGTGLDAAAGVLGQTLTSNGAGGYTLGDPIAGSLATNDVTDGGLGVIRFYGDQATMALDAGHEYKGAALGSVADASTWTELLEVAPPLPGSEIVTFDFFAADMADAPDGGAADTFGCVFKFILTRTNSGAVYYQPYPPNAAPVALDASTPPCNVGFGSQDGGVITSFPGSFQLVNRAGTVFLEWKAVPGQSPWKSSSEVDARRRKP